MAGHSTLSDLVQVYGEHDSQAKELKKVCDEEKEQIKRELREQQLKNFVSEGYKVTYQVSERVTLDTDKMVHWLQEYWNAKESNEPCPYLKTIVVLNEDALETALYKQELPEYVIEQLNSCRSVKEVETLKCSKIEE